MNDTPANREGALTCRAGTLSLALQIFVRTVGGKYRRSFLGYFWMVFPALLFSGGAILAASSGATNLRLPTGVPVFLWVFTAVMIWQAFSEMFSVPTEAIEGARSYLTRVAFPRETIIIAQAAEIAISTLVRLALLLVAAALSGWLGLWGVMQVLLALLAACLLGIGLGSLLAPFMILFTDLRDFMRYVMNFGIFLTPALFQPSTGPFAAIVQANPISILITAARGGLLSAEHAGPGAILLALAAGIVLTLVGVVVFRLGIPIVVERMLLGGR